MDIFQELKNLKSLLDEGVLSEEEFAQAKATLLGGARRSGPDSDPFPPVRPDRPGRDSLHDFYPNKEVGADEHRFRLISPLGDGGMGVVWRALDLRASAVRGRDFEVALKMLPPGVRASDTEFQRLRKEAFRARDLNHPHIVNVYDWHEDPGGWVFVSMEYLKGRNLDKVLAEEGPEGLPLERVIELLSPVAEAIDWAYQEHRLVHRDLKPGNVFLTQANRIKVLDFGLSAEARSTSSASQIEGTDRSGTIPYMPPEAFARCRPHPSRDVYALAVMAYQLLTGYTPWPPESAERRHPQTPWPEAPEVLSEAQWEGLKQGLAYEKGDRQATASALVQSLTAKARAKTRRPRSEPSLSGKRIVLPPVQDIHGWSTEKVQALQRQTAEALGRELVFRDRLIDGAEGPDMVVIPPGSFLMGSPESEKERFSDERQHRVEIARLFAIGRYPVTFAEYDRFCASTKRVKPDDDGWGRGRRPVISVSWTDALEYAAWLSAQTGKAYRLPTEADWEYTARAGTATAYWWGDEIGRGRANCDGCGSRWDNEQTAPVGSFDPNPWGLYDVHGNVWEWVEDCWHDSYAGAPSDGSAWTVGGDCAQRVRRGGSWNFNPWLLRSALRNWYDTGDRNNSLGFRVARALTP